MTEDDDLDQAATATDIVQFLDILAEEATRLHLGRTATALRQARLLCRREGHAAQGSEIAAWGSAAPIQIGALQMGPPQMGAMGTLVVQNSAAQMADMGRQWLKPQLLPARPRRRGSVRGGLARR